MYGCIISGGNVEMEDWELFVGNNGVEDSVVFIGVRNKLWL